MPKKAEKKVESKEPVQAEVNIGLVGHVDHGKCIAVDELLLLNNELSNGSKVIQTACDSFEKSKVSDSETLFKSPGFKAFSLSPDFQPVSVNANFFVQNYSGRMFEIETNRGKRLKASPKHPLLVNNGRELVWKRSEQLKKGDFVASLKRIPSQGFIKDFSPNWINSISADCWVVSKTDFDLLSDRTVNFSFFEELAAEDFNTLRILMKKSISYVEKKAGFNAGELSTALKSRLNSRQKNLLIEFFKKHIFKRPRGILLNFKKKSQSFCEVNFDDYWNDSILRFLALVVAEGYCTGDSVRFSQADNELRSEFLKYCKELFGVSPKFYPPVDFQIHNKALFLFLREKYGLKKGNSRAAGIPEWVFTLPNNKTAVFLNAFFSAEANFNIKSNQIALVQANKKSIDIISYCLKKFGISHSVHDIKKCATNGCMGKRQYWQLLVSGNENIIKFSEEIGVSLPYKHKALEKMREIAGKGKKSDEMIPLNFELFSEIIESLGWKKKNYSVKTLALKRQPWFWAFQDCNYKNAISRKNLSVFIEACNKRIEFFRLLKQQVQDTPLKKIMAEIGISQCQLALNVGISQKQASLALKSRKETNVKQALITEIISELEKRINESMDLLEIILGNSPENIEWDKIKTIKEMDYSGPIIDLQVPGYHNFIAGTGALISHNTSLTKALSGVWTDTHSEELKKGISIRLGYADAIFRKCPKCKGSEAYTNKEKCHCGSETKLLRKVSFVDAPGHETLMTTMLSGAALMQGAILVIAANEETPQPRTIEHLTALKISGIENIVVAQNKIDLVEKEKAVENYNQIKKFLQEFGYGNTPIIPTAAHFGTNIDLLIEAIQERIPTPNYDLDKPLKMYVARSFDINKPGAKPEELVGGVLGGSIEEGKANVGDEIEISPGMNGKKINAKIKSLSTFTSSLQEARPGGLVSIGTSLDPTLTKNDQMRGQVIGMKGSLPEPVNALDLEFHPLERSLIDSNEEIKVNDQLILTVGTATILGIVTKIKKDRIELNLKIPVVISKGQKVAISKRIATAWRLVAYGVKN